MSTTDVVNQMTVSAASWTISSLISAVVTLLACLVAIRVVTRLLSRVLERSKLDTRIQTLAVSGIRVLLYIVTAVVTAQGLGINTTSFVALLSVASLGITMAAEDALGNFAGGLVLFSAHPFSIGDLIETSGNLGTVQEIRLNHTRILTPNGQFVYIPNKSLASDRIINYTALGRRRIACTINASYDAPDQDIMDACMEAVNLTENILPDPAPAVWLTDCGTSSVEYTIHCWTQPDNYWASLCTLRLNLRKTFADHGVEMTYDHMNIHIINEQPEKGDT